LRRFFIILFFAFSLQALYDNDVKVCLRLHDKPVEPAALVPAGKPGERSFYKKMQKRDGKRSRFIGQAMSRLSIRL
jgi:hypothetical protein